MWYRQDPPKVSTTSKSREVGNPGASIAAAIHAGNVQTETTPVAFGDPHRNSHARSSFLLLNWVVQSVCTLATSVLTFVILFVVAYGVKGGIGDQRPAISDQRPNRRRLRSGVFPSSLSIASTASELGDSGRILRSLPF